MFENILTFIDMLCMIHISIKIDLRGGLMDLQLNSDSRYVTTAKVFKALCDENRLMILDLLKDGEQCACVMLETLNIAQSTLSHHMKILVESGLVVSRRDGKWTHYGLSQDGFVTAKQLLNDFTCDMDVSKEVCICK